MNSASSVGRLSLGTWAPCPAEPPAEAMDESRRLQADVNDACHEDCGVIRLFVGTELSDEGPTQHLAAS